MRIQDSITNPVSLFFVTSAKAKIRLEQRVDFFDSLTVP